MNLNRKLWLAISIFMWPRQMMAEEPSFPGNRLLTGLEQYDFEITVNGTPSAITYFNYDSPASIAIVGADPQQELEVQSGDELFRVKTVAEALQKLAMAQNLRKALVATANVDTSKIPEGIQILVGPESSFPRAVLEVHNSCLLGYKSFSPASTLKVAIKGTENLPKLNIIVD